MALSFLSTEGWLQFPFLRNRLRGKVQSGNGKGEPVCAGDTLLPVEIIILTSVAPEFIMPSCSYPYFVHGAARLSVLFSGMG